MSGFGVVRSLSPANIDPAPAIKHMACPSSVICVLPAESRTVVFGRTILVVATILIISQIGIFSCSSMGVPSTATSALIGTDSGYGFNVDKVTNIAALSIGDSPIPIMPPEQTVRPAFLTFPMVSIRSSYPRVEITFL